VLTWQQLEQGKFAHLMLRIGKHLNSTQKQRSPADRARGPRRCRVLTNNLSLVRITIKRRNNRVPAVSPAGIGLVWTEGIRAVDGRHARVRDLDEKSTPLLAFGLAAFALIHSSEAIALTDARLVLSLLLGIGLIATLVALAPRDVASVPRFSDLVPFARRPPSSIQELYIGNFLEAIELTETALQSKTRWFHVAVAAYIDALIVAGGYTLFVR
jgi:hypothetical protein